MEPSAGNGAVIRAIEGFAPLLVPSWHAIEVRDEERDALTIAVRTGTVRIADFLRSDLDDVDPRIAVVIGNPPYRHAEEFIWRARQLCPTAEVAYLLRIAFASSAERHPLMSRFPPDIYALPDRPSFTGDGSDNADYAWFVWPPSVQRREHGTFRVLNRTSLEERKRDRGHRVLVEDPQLGLGFAP